MPHHYTASPSADAPDAGRSSRRNSFNVACPACLSIRVTSLDTGKQSCAAIGTLAGAAGALSAALSGAARGARVGICATPALPSLGAVAGAIVGGLSGGIAGCTVGAALGEAIDASILRNRRCLACGHRFSAPRF